MDDETYGRIVSVIFMREEAVISNRHHILILVENLPVPFDRRVWQQVTPKLERR
jgi:hypothetical protein